jgi:hypothetical protein
MMQRPAAIGITVIGALWPVAIAGEKVAMPVQLVGAALVTLKAPA